MISFQKHQLAEISENSQQKFNVKLVKHLRTRFPEQTEGFTDAELHRDIEELQARCAKIRIHRAYDIQILAELHVRGVLRNLISQQYPDGSFEDSDLSGAERVLTLQSADVFGRMGNDEQD